VTGHLLVVHKVSLCFTFQVIVLASTRKQKVLDFATKIEIIQACENSNVSKIEIGRHYNLSLSAYFTIVKKQRQN
jgi:phosphopantetheine adenylyltransferase